MTQYRLVVYFYYTSQAGKQGIKLFRNGAAKRKLKKSCDHYNRKGFECKFEIFDLPQDNCQWVLDSNNLGLLKETEAELTTAVERKLKGLTTGSFFDKARKIKMLRIGEKVKAVLESSNMRSIIAEGQQHLLTNFTYYKDGKELEKK